MKILTLENYDQLQPYIEQANYNEYNSNSITMLMWSSMYEVHFETFPHYAITYTKRSHHAAKWLMPFCAPQYRQEAIQQIQKYAKALNIPFEIHSMTVEFKNWLTTAYPQEYLVWDCFDAQDYIYDRKQQETLSGKKMQKRRNHYHAFLKQYEKRFAYKPLAHEDVPRVYEFLSYWQTLKGQTDSIDAEDIGIHLLLSNMDTLPIQGGCIYIDGKLEAFNITSMLAHDTVQIHVEKANRNIRGLYIAILKLFLENLDEQVVYVNREDDMGNPDLRKAKSDMQPIRKTQKFACSHEPIAIRKAKEQDLNDIVQLWTTRFHDETKQSSAFFFAHLYHMQDCYILRSQEELISMVQLRKMNIMLEGQSTLVSFVVGVATNEDYEGCGYMKALLNHALASISKEEPFTLLQAYDWDIYKPFGFVETYKTKRTKIDKQGYTKPCGELLECIDANALLPLYNAYTKDKQGFRIRDLAYYEDYLIPYHKLWGQSILVHRFHGKNVGYVILNKEEDSITAIECVYRDEEQLKSMISLLCEDTRKVYVDCDSNTVLQGRVKERTCMMVKEHGEQHFPKDRLFIKEEL